MFLELSQILWVPAMACKIVRIPAPSRHYQFRAVSVKVNLDGTISNFP